MYLDIKHCPHCGAELDADTEIFVRGWNVIGCEHCVRQTWGDWDEDDEDDYDDEERDADIYDSLCDELKLERVFGL